MQLHNMTNITTLKNKYFILLILTGINIVIIFTSIRIDNQLEWKVWNMVTTCYTLDKICQWLATGVWFFPLVFRFPPPIKLTRWLKNTICTFGFDSKIICFLTSFYKSYFSYGGQKLLLFQTRGMDRTKEIRYLKKNCEKSGG